MADLAVGLSKTVVAEALTKVQSAIDQDTKLRQKAQRDLVTITLEFEMMNSFLSIANGDRATNNLVITWVRHVRELAYDLEDCVEFVVHLDSKRIFWRRLLPSCMVAPLLLDQAVMEIEDLKGRAKELSECYSRYSHIADPDSNPVMVQKQQQQLGSSWPTGATSSANMFAEARDAARGKQGLGDLTQMITNKDNQNDPQLQEISVWGTGGDLGTTSVYTNTCKETGSAVGVHVHKKMNAGQERLLTEFLQEVNTKTYLVVLENLADMVDWDAVRTFLPDTGIGSWIIVSTQEFEIASLCIGDSYQPLELKQFSPDHSVCVFLKQGSQDYGEDNHEKQVFSQMFQNTSYKEAATYLQKKKEAATYWMKNYPLVGRQTEMNELRSYTARARFDSSQVISVWGIAGIGKSALVRNLYCDRILCTDQFNMYSWVDVSHPFNLRDFSRRLLSDFDSERDPIKEGHELLKQHNCLVVIDDLQSKEEWDLIQSALVSRPSGTVIIVITTEASVASYCTNNEDQVFNVKGLEADVSMDLFRNEVQRNNPLCHLSSYRHAELEELILKCGVRRWIAEGYSRDSEEESAIDKVETFFSKLLDLSIIQQIPQIFTTAFGDTRMVACQVNGFIHEYIVSRRMEEKLVFELGPNCVLTTQRTGRHLIILNTWDRDRIVFESIDFSRLRSLTVIGKWESFFISKSMRLLRVLDLKDSSGVKDEDLKMMVRRLLRLKFLSLRGCTEIFHLPNSLGNLRQLQTLDVRHTPIVTLPASICKLQKLQYVCAGTKIPASTRPASSSRLTEFLRHRGLVGVKVPRWAGKLTALRTLGIINVGASGGKAIVEELKKLTQLRKLGVSGINKHNIKELLSATSGHVHLESLFVQVDKDSQSCLDADYLPWKNLQSLTLYGLKDTFPLEISLSKLSKLDLEMDTLQINGMEFLAKLPELCIVHLRVKQLELHFQARLEGLELDTFKKVKILKVTSRSNSLDVTFGSKSLKKLELLMLDCSSASYELNSLDGLSELKEVFLKGTSDEAIKTKIETQLISHPKTPTVKLGGLPPST
ncbi:unnamed protein product [Alopecurus aequalis]